METTTEAPSKAPVKPEIISSPPGVPASERRLSPALRTGLIVAGAIAVLILLVVLVRWIAYATSHQTTDDAQINADQVQITSKIAERVDRILVDTNQQVRRGQLLIQLDDRDERARLQQAQASRDALTAQARAAEETVALTGETQAAQNEQSNGSVAQAQSAIQSAANQSLSAQDQIAADQAAVDASRAELVAAQDALPGASQRLVQAQADLTRTQSLVATGDVAAAQLDSARAVQRAAWSALAGAQANVAAARAQLDEAIQKLNSQRYTSSSAAAQVGVEQGTLTTAQGHLAESSAAARVPAQEAQAQAAFAQVATAQAQLATARDQLSYTQIRSPIDGFVGQKSVEIGATVQPGQALMTLVPANHIYITANYKETQIGSMRAGQQVDIGVDAYHGVNFTGHVDAIAPASENVFSLVPAQNATGNFVKVTQRVPVRIVFDNPDPKYPLRPGMSVETSVKVK